MKRALFYTGKFFLILVVLLTSNACVFDLPEEDHDPEKYGEEILTMTVGGVERRYDASRGLYDFFEWYRGQYSLVGSTHGTLMLEFSKNMQPGIYSGEALKTLLDNNTFGFSCYDEDFYDIDTSDFVLTLSAFPGPGGVAKGSLNGKLTSPYTEVVKRISGSFLLLIRKSK